MSKSSPHDSAELHVSGTAEYIDDRLPVAGEVHVEAVYSHVASGEITSIDIKEALRAEGILGIFSAADLKVNKWGSIFHDQPFLADKEVNFIGEPILVIAGETREAIFLAKKKIKIEIKEHKPVLSIAQARVAKAFIGPSRTISRGDVNAALAGAKHRFADVIEMAGQDHFYLESQACVVYPKEDGQLEIHSSSQHPSEVQHLVADALGLKLHQVVCIVKRMGGAFGGKESQAAPFAVFASLVAQKLNRPARLILTKDDDMRVTGKRNPFQNHYEVGFEDDGTITALKVDLFSDGGAFADLSTAIMERAMLHSDNAYFIPNMQVRGQVCKTHTPPNTAFRGFGGPKGIAMIENIIEQIAERLGLDPLDVREKNVYKKGQTTHYGQEIDDSVLPDLFKQLRSSCEYDSRRKEIEKFNAGDNGHYRGISMTAVKFGISFTTRFLNQANALVNVHMDGTVQVSTGAVEMGQGVNTKIADVVAEVFSIPVADVRVMPTSTEKNHNTSATAASSGSDLNGRAAEVAAGQIRDRMAKVAYVVLNRPVEMRGRPIAGAGVADEIKIDDQPAAAMIFKDGWVIDPKDPSKKISFGELVHETFLNRVSLSGYGFYRYPAIHFNKETGHGHPFFYFTNGVACSEVSVDRLTGEMKVLRSDILMDLGRVQHYGIDHGQVTGAFIQGMGWLTTEQLVYSAKGDLLTFSPSTYKIPSIQDIPRVFNVELIDNPNNSRNLKGSKAVGEPPLMLAISVWTAVRHALTFRKRKVHMRVPATQERIFMNLHGPGL